MYQLFRTWETGTIENPTFHLELKLEDQDPDRRNALQELIQRALAGGQFKLVEGDDKEKKPSALGFQIETEEEE